MQAKVCGLTTSEQVKTCVSHGANFCGFILNYKKSHRFINYETAEQLTQIDRQNTFYVGVLVNPSEKEEKVREIKKNYKKKIIISLQIKQEKDILKYKTYKKVADIVLFDSSGLHQSLSWNYNWIGQVSSSVVKMLAGNINIDMLKNLKDITDIVDVSGALETDKVKDLDKIRIFLKKIKQIND